MQYSHALRIKVRCLLRQLLLFHLELGEALSLAAGQFVGELPQLLSTSNNFGIAELDFSDYTRESGERIEIVLKFSYFLSKLFGLRWASFL